MKNYNQPNPDTGFISTIRDKITWIPLITFLCIIFMFFASSLLEVEKQAFLRYL